MQFKTKTDLFNDHVKALSATNAPLADKISATFSAGAADLDSRTPEFLTLVAAGKGFDAIAKAMRLNDGGVHEYLEDIFKVAGDLPHATSAKGGRAAERKRSDIVNLQTLRAFLVPESLSATIR